MNIFKKLSNFGIFKQQKENLDLNKNNDSQISMMNKLLSVERKWNKVNTPGLLDRKKKKNDINKKINILEDLLSSNEDENNNIISKKIKKTKIESNKEIIINDIKSVKNKFLKIKNEFKNNKEINYYFNIILEKLEKS